MWGDLSISRTRWNVGAPKRLGIPRRLARPQQAPSSPIFPQACRRTGLPFYRPLTQEDNSESETEGSIWPSSTRGPKRETVYGWISNSEYLRSVRSLKGTSIYRWTNWFQRYPRSNSQRVWKASSFDYLCDLELRKGISMFEINRNKGLQVSSGHWGLPNLSVLMCKMGIIVTSQSFF